MKMLWGLATFTLALSMNGVASATSHGQLTTAQDLHATRTTQGYTLTGELLAWTPCMTTAFRPLSTPDTYAAEQSPPADSTRMCIQVLTWKKTHIARSAKLVPKIVRVLVRGNQYLNVRVETPR